MDRRDYYGAYGSGSYAGPYYGTYGTRAYVDTPGVLAIERYRANWGNDGWDGYASRNGIVCAPGTIVTMGGQQYLCQ